jgi:hypothetical protein
VTLIRRKDSIKLVRKLLPLAICYDFDGTLAPGNMQERDFIPAIGMTKKAFWSEVKADCIKHDADEILIYMKLMLSKATSKAVTIRKEDFEKYGKGLTLFDGVEGWFKRVNDYGKGTGITVSHHIISSGIREMISGSTISKNFKNIYMPHRFVMTTMELRCGLHLQLTIQQRLNTSSVSIKEVMTYTIIH